MMVEKKVDDAIREIFRPEFLNRIDQTVVFDALTRHELGAIVNLMLTEVTTDLARKSIQISFTDEARAFLLDHGFDPKFGARPLSKTVQRHVEDEMAEWVLTGRIVPGLSLIHISEPTRLGMISYAVF